MHRNQMLLCALMLTISSSLFAVIRIEQLPTIDPNQYEVQLVPKPQYKPFLEKYGISMGTGTAVGLLSGYGCAKFENYMFGRKAPLIDKILCFIVFNGISSGALKIASEGFDEYHIQYHEKALYSSQWLASWIAYLMVD
jgi:hypothetical protein